MWLLILMIGDTYGAQYISSAEFYNERACVEAKVAIERKYWAVYQNAIAAVCVKES